MSKSLGRNDPCYCNSGKKYKYCHMKPFLPKEFFNVHVTQGNPDPSHMAYRDGVWHQEPGILEMTVWFTDKEYEYGEISDILSPVANLKHDSASHLKERVNKLHHKLSAIKFHSDNFKKEEDDKIRQFMSSYHGVNFHYVIDNPKLIYELEAFLFQTKSCLDVLAQTIGLVFKLGRVNTYKNNGDELITQLKNNCPKYLKEHAPKLIKIIERNTKWVSDTVDMRDEITHYSDLIGFSCFINRAWTGGEYAQIFYPSMPEGIRVRTYLNDTWKKLADLVKDFVSIIVIVYVK